MLGNWELFKSYTAIARLYKFFTFLFTIWRMTYNHKTLCVQLCFEIFVNFSCNFCKNWKKIQAQVSVKLELPDFIRLKIYLVNVWSKIVTSSNNQTYSIGSSVVQLNTILHFVSQIAHQSFHSQGWIVIKSGLQAFGSHPSAYTFSISG